MVVKVEGTKSWLAVYWANSLAVSFAQASAQKPVLVDLQKSQLDKRSPRFWETLHLLCSIDHDVTSVCTYQLTKCVVLPSTGLTAKTIACACSSLAQRVYIHKIRTSLIWNVRPCCASRRPCCCPSALPHTHPQNVKKKKNKRERTRSSCTRATVRRPTDQECGGSFKPPT